MKEGLGPAARQECFIALSLRECDQRHAKRLKLFVVRAQLDSNGVLWCDARTFQLSGKVNATADLAEQANGIEMQAKVNVLQFTSHRRTPVAAFEIVRSLWKERIRARKCLPERCDLRDVEPCSTKS